MRRIGTTTMVLAAVGLAVGACGGDDDDAGVGDVAADVDDAASAAADAAADGGASGGGGGGGGVLVLGDETIELDSARCFLEEQDAAAGGGKILFVGQGFGTNAAGEEILVDISRWDEDSQFTGDDIIVDVGDPFSDTAVNYRAGGDIGTVTLDGSTLSADGLTFQNSDDFEEQLSGSVRIDC